jgi:hypothetical protein
MPKQLNCNEDLVRDLLNYSPYGALGQAFVMEAIQAYAKGMLAAPRADETDNEFISQATWRGIAADVKARCDAFYRRHEVAP